MRVRPSVDPCWRATTTDAAATAGARPARATGTGTR